MQLPWGMLSWGSPCCAQQVNPSGIVTMFRDQSNMSSIQTEGLMWSSRVQVVTGALSNVSNVHAEGEYGVHPHFL